mgnify:CR=1 FL=1
MKYVACFLSAVLLFTLVPLQQLFADIPLPEPTGKIILTVDGRITNKNLGERTVFDHPLGCWNFRIHRVSAVEIGCRNRGPGNNHACDRPGWV